MHCKESGLADLLNQWHPTKNKDLTPAMVSAGSHKKVWWRCERGHEWQSQVRIRLNGGQCPICKNRKITPGENDLATTNPELAEQWHPEKNGELTPDQVFAGGNQKVWWRCKKGHEWQAQIYSRGFGNFGCPVCAGKVIIPGENDLASTFPDIARAWHPTKNGELTAENVSPYSNRKVWWQCELGHEWETIIAHRAAKGTGCPYCAGRKVLPGFNDLNTKHPNVAAQWHPTLNGELTAEMVTPNSHKKVWWICPLGHVWKSVVYSRTSPKKATGCPVCAGTVKEKQ